jgi:hypothetical protein
MNRLVQPLKEPGHLFVSFPILCIYFSTVLVYAGSIVGEPTPISFIESAIFFFFWIRSGKNPPCNLFIQSIKKIKKEKEKEKENPITYLIHTKSIGTNFLFNSYYFRYLHNKSNFNRKKNAREI